MLDRIREELTLLDQEIEAGFLPAARIRARKLRLLLTETATPPDCSEDLACEIGAALVAWDQDRSDRAHKTGDADDLEDAARAVWALEMWRSR